MVTLQVGHRTCRSQVTGSSPGWAPLRNVLGQANYICVSLSPSTIIWYQARGTDALWLLYRCLSFERHPGAAADSAKVMSVVK